MKSSSSHLFAYAIFGMFFLITSNLIFSHKRSRNTSLTKVFDQGMVPPNREKVVLRIKDKKVLAYETISAEVDPNTGGTKKFCCSPIIDGGILRRSLSSVIMPNEFQETNPVQRRLEFTYS